MKINKFFIGLGSLFFICAVIFARDSIFPSDKHSPSHSLSSQGLIFFHIPKCGGTTVDAPLRKYFNIKEDYPYSNFHLNYDSPEKNKILLKEHPYVAGHIFLKDLVEINQGIYRKPIITVMRSPVPRLISFLRYLKQRAISPIPLDGTPFEKHLSTRFPNYYKMMMLLRDHPLTDEKMLKKILDSNMREEDAHVSEAMHLPVVALLVSQGKISTNGLLWSIGIFPKKGQQIDEKFVDKVVDFAASNIDIILFIDEEEPPLLDQMSALLKMDLEKKKERSLNVTESTPQNPPIDLEKNPKLKDFLYEQCKWDLMFYRKLKEKIRSNHKNL